MIEWNEERVMKINPLIILPVGIMQTLAGAVPSSRNGHGAVQAATRTIAITASNSPAAGFSEHFPWS